MRNKTITVDIETWIPGVLGGIHPGEMTLYTAGRQTGKSTYSQYVKQWHNIMSTTYNSLATTTWTQAQSLC